MEGKKLNASPLGLIGFGMTTVLLNLHNAGVIGLTSVILAMGLALGGLAQLIAGIFEFKNNNTFGGTAFIAYGSFWWSLVYIFKSGGADGISMGFYLLLWAVFTAFMFIGTLKHDCATQIVFGSLTLLFLLLSIDNFTGSELIKQIAGIEGILCGLSAVYTCGAKIIKEEYGRVILPIGEKKH